MLNTKTKPACAGTESVGKRASNLIFGSKISKRVLDLQWQINFTQMKLDNWHEREDTRWMNLVRMHEHAKRQLMAMAG